MRKDGVPSPLGRMGVPLSARLGTPRKCEQTDACENITSHYPLDAGAKNGNIFQSNEIHGVGVRWQEQP